MKARYTTGPLPRSSRVSWWQRTLKALTISISIITSGSLGSEFKCGMYGCENLGAVGSAILETCSLQKFSHVDVKI